jgi:hypothetical protein
MLAGLKMAFCNAVSSNYFLSFLWMLLEMYPEKTKNSRKVIIVNIYVIIKNLVVHGAFILIQ